MKEIVALTDFEGGYWTPYEKFDHDKLPASELWSDGRVYDYILGRWRSGPIYTPDNNATMANYHRKPLFGCCL